MCCGVRGGWCWLWCWLPSGRCFRAPAAEKLASDLFCYSPTITALRMFALGERRK
ncbi:hypothetical protein EI94DRAFT_1748897 [Lactarius quietus]|nr:hypothetical protein EI94DRAFT_1748897 [Lactarius quietus]